MRTTADYLDALQRRFGVPSDYALQKHTGWKLQQISRYRTMRGSFDDTTALKVAAWLNAPPTQILVDMQAQRARENPTLHAVWELVGKKVSGVAAGVLLGVLIAPSSPSEWMATAAAMPAVEAQALCIMLSVALALLSLRIRRE